MKNKFIVIEGCDFTGKSTVIEKLVKTLRESGIESFPAKVESKDNFKNTLDAFLKVNINEIKKK